MDYALYTTSPGHSVVSAFSEIFTTSPELGSLHHHITDHVFQHRHALGCLPVTSQVKYHSLCAMYLRQYCHCYCISLDSPLLFGPQHMYGTCCPPYFTNLQRCTLTYLHSEIILS